MNTTPSTASRENVVRVQNGWMMLVLLLAVLSADVALLVFHIPEGSFLGVCVVLLPVIIFLMIGFFTLQPNESRVLVLFGAYKGTVRENGFHWGNPFYSNGPGQWSGIKGEKAVTRGTTGRNKISLRARVLNAERLKVNDKRGNPIEIAAVVVWRVADTAQAMFDVDRYENYITTQSESALRHLASLYSYDDGGENEITLRSNVEEVSRALRVELDERVEKAGMVIDEARLTHLAYAPEIAQAMLRRQQAEAVIAAREKIVHGAVSMVHMALTELADKEVVHLDDER